MKYSRKETIDPGFFVGAIKDYDGSPIDVRNQMDVDEFFISLLDTLENQLKELKKHEFLDLCFLGELYQEIVGDRCGHKTTKIDKFLALSLSVENITKIEGGLRNYIKWENLEGDNAYHCEKCDAKVKARKRIAINHLPNYLIITLKRFDFNFETLQKTKLNNYVEFPERLDMTDYTEEFLNNKKMNDISYYKYRLRGVIIHMGTSEYGHYYSIIKKDDEWFIFNDSETKPFDFSQLGNEAFGDAGKGKNAYVLFYEREEFFDGKGKQITNLAIKRRDSERFDTNNFITGVKNEIIDGEYSEYVSTFLGTKEYMTFIKDIKTIDDDLRFKLLIRYFTIYLIRDIRKNQMYDFYDIISTLLDGSFEDCIYLIRNFTDNIIFAELLVENPSEEVQLLVYGLLRKAIGIIEERFKEIVDTSKKTLVVFFDNLIDTVNESIKKRQFALYAVYLIKDMVIKNKISEIINTDSLFSFLQTHFTSEGRFIQKELESFPSEFEQKMVTRFRHSNSLRTIKQTVTLPDEKFVACLSSFTCLFSKLHKHKFDFSRIYRTTKFWTKAIDKISLIREGYQLAEGLLLFAKEDPRAVAMLFKDFELRASNFKTILIIFDSIITVEKTNICDVVFFTLRNFLNSAHCNNYVIRDCVIHSFLRLASRSKLFFNLLNGESFYRNLKRKNEELKDFYYFDSDNVV